MPNLNPAWVEAVKAGVNPCPYFDLQSMRIVDLAPSLSRLEVALAPKHLQPFGIVHGGVFSSLIDAAGFWAAFTETAPGLGLTTVEMKLNYLAPAVDGVLIGLGKCLKHGKTLALAEARVENAAGKLLAHGTVTLMAMPSLQLPGQAELPQKFQGE
jgi:uncharacterized protein (TIGR00369 family)